METAINLGTGVLTWSGAERRSDRYGTVWLMNDGATSETEGIPVNKVSIPLPPLEGVRGELRVKVIDARVSTHIGDIYHGIFPSKPEVGEIITLGQGTFFTEDGGEWGRFVGLRPEDDREFHWLDVPALYRAHEQLVEMTFHVA